jgi:hypothetical protein
VCVCVVCVCVRVCVKSSIGWDFFFLEKMSVFFRKDMMETALLGCVCVCVCVRARALIAVQCTR